jgi:histone acetyltransferase (RNA polymerase elongator complex component)
LPFRQFFRLKVRLIDSKRGFIMRPYIIPIFIPHYGCPHQCVFCDQTTITGIRHRVGGSEVAAIISETLARLKPDRKVEIAFYGGTFTALPAATQEELLAPARAALDRGDATAIRVSTRPDAIDSQTAKRLIDYRVSIVELGAQSLDDRVLAAAGRGHSSSDTINAVDILKSFRLKVGLQFMPGLPGEDWASLIQTATLMLRLRPDFIRIYPTVVIAGTKLAAMYCAEQYRPLSLKAAIARAAYLKLLADQHGILVIRLGLQATDGLSAPGTVLAGPYHPAFGEMVAAFIFNLKVSRLFEMVADAPYHQLTIHHHPKDHSKLRGLAGKNLRNWRQRYTASDIRLVGDWPYRDELGVCSNGILYVVNDAMMNNC